MNSTIQGASRHIAWEQLRERIESGIPFVHRIPGLTVSVPFIDIRVAESGSELSMHIPYTAPAHELLPALSEIDICLITTVSGPVIEIKTRLYTLFQEVYNFFVSIIDKIQLHDTNPFAAINETMDGWRELLQVKALLSEEAQLGLRGELYLLRAIIPILGAHAVWAWIGPQNQPHDFRIGDIEVEVKATRGAIHGHIINGLSQLEPTPGHRLYVFSLRFAPAGALGGTTLPDEIEKTRGLLGISQRVKFDAIIRDRFGFRDERKDSYRLRLQLADIPNLIPVDERCPRLSVPLLAAVPHRGRIQDVRYRVNLEGLGFNENSAEYANFLSELNAKAKHEGKF